MATKSIDRLTRDELNLLAGQRGMAEPEQYETKGELLTVLTDDYGVDASEKIDTDTLGGPESDASTDPDPIPTSDDTDDPEPAEAPDDGLIAVTGRTPKNRTSLWERNAAHPGGEIYVRGGQTVRVAETPMVQLAIRQGRLARA